MTTDIYKERLQDINNTVSNVLDITKEAIVKATLLYSAIEESTMQSDVIEGITDILSEALDEPYGTEWAESSLVQDIIKNVLDIIDYEDTTNLEIILEELNA